MWESPQYYCHACGAHRTLVPKHLQRPLSYRVIDSENLSRAGQLHGLERIFQVSRQTVAHWLRTVLRTVPQFKQTVLPAQPGDVLELDELWSFVLNKGQKRWLWIALCRRTRQVVAFTIGDRSEKTCRRLWNKLPAGYRPGQAYSDFWDAYQKVWPAETHKRWAKSPAKPRRSSAGTTPCDNASPAMSAKRCRSRSPTFITGLSRLGSSSNTT